MTILLGSGGFALAQADEEVAASVPEPGSEVIEIWEERPDKPFDRDTEERLSGEELARRGIATLDEALELLPELNVREAGRGGRQVDIRGARKGSVKILIDGIPVSDPYYGNIDLQAIPVTDIVQIRISAAPSSPIDGPGGPGGVIEIHTRDAVGARLLRSRAQISTSPGGDVATTGRTMVGKHFAVRASASGVLGHRDFEVARPEGGTSPLGEDRRGAASALRLEYRRDDTRVALDGWLQHKSFVVPPGDEGMRDILVVDGETVARAGLSASANSGKWRVAGRLYGQHLARRSRSFSDLALTDETGEEDLSALGVGAHALANRALGKRFHFVTSAGVHVDDATAETMSGAEAGGRAGAAELAAGLQYFDYPLRVDVAAGLAVPVGVDASPWPEVKAQVAYTAGRTVTFKGTVARKGRVPTLRERFQLGVGNQSLGPEHVLYASVGVQIKPGRDVVFDVESYERRTNGLVRFDLDAGTLINLGDLTIRGFDARLELFPKSSVGGGASYSFIDAYDPEQGLDPLDFLPRHRSDVWLALRLRERAYATVRARTVGEQVDGRTTLEPCTTFHATVHGRLSGVLSASLRVDDVFDAQPEVRSGGVLAPGRTAVLSIIGHWE